MMDQQQQPGPPPNNQSPAPTTEAMDATTAATSGVSQQQTMQHFLQQQQAQQQTAAAAPPPMPEWEAFTFALETESVFFSRDLLVSTLCAPTKKRFSLLTPEGLLMMLATDPQFAELAAELYKDPRYKDLQSLVATIVASNGTAPSLVPPTSLTTAGGATAASGTTASTAPGDVAGQPLAGAPNATMTDVQQQQQQPMMTAEQAAALSAADSNTSRRVALAQRLPAELWARLLEVKLTADKQAALRAKGFVFTTTTVTSAPMLSSLLVPSSSSTVTSSTSLQQQQQQQQQALSAGTMADDESKSDVSKGGNSRKKKPLSGAMQRQSLKSASMAAPSPPSSARGGQDKLLVSSIDGVSSSLPISSTFSVATSSAVGAGASATSNGGGGASTDGTSTPTAAGSGGPMTVSSQGKRVQTSVAGKKKRRTAGESVDEVPAGVPDMLYLLDGFPNSLDSVEKCRELGVQLGAMVSASVTSSFRRLQQQQTQLQQQLPPQQGGSQQPGGGGSQQAAATATESIMNKPRDKMASKQGQRPRKKKGGAANNEDDSDLKPVTMPTFQETQPVFSSFHNEMKQNSGVNTLWLEVVDLDPNDPNEAAHRITNKLFDVFSLKMQYSAWIKTCNITELLASVDYEQVFQGYKAIAKVVPDVDTTPATIVHCITDKAANQQSQPQMINNEESSGGEDAVEAQLVQFLDDTLSWLTGETTTTDNNRVTTSSSSTAAMGKQAEGGLHLLKFGDEIALKSTITCSPDAAQICKQSESLFLNTTTKDPVIIPGLKRNGMPSEPVKSDLERATYAAEMTDFLSTVGAIKPNLSASEVDRILTLLAFEDMMMDMAPPATEGNAWKFDDHVYLEHFEPEVFAQVYSKARREKANIYTQYYVDKDAMLVCLDSGVPAATRMKESTWKSSINPKITFKQWLDTVTASGALISTTTTEPLAPSALQRTPTADSVSSNQAATTGGVDKSKMEAVCERMRPVEGSTIYNVEEQKIRIEKQTKQLFLEDGSTATVTKTIHPTQFLVDTVLSFNNHEDTFALHVTKQAKKQTSVTATQQQQQPQMSFTSTFADGSNLWIGELQGSLKLSYTLPNGAVSVFGMAGKLDQILPPLQQQQTTTTATTHHHHHSHHNNTSIVEDPWSSSTENESELEAIQEEEVSRRLVASLGPSNQPAVVRFLSGGSVQILYAEGDTEYYNPRTQQTIYTSPTGERVTKSKTDSSATRKVMTGAAQVTDPETGQIVITREDMTMLIRSPTGDVQSRFPDGTTIRKTANGVVYFENQLQTQQPPVKLETLNGGNGSNSNRVLTTKFDDDSRIMCNQGSIEFVKANSTRIVLSQDGTVTVRALIYDDDEEEEKKKQQQQQQQQEENVVRPGTYTFQMKTGSVTTPEYDHSKFVVTVDGLVDIQRTTADTNSGSGKRVPAQVSHPPRLFRVMEDGSATEYISSTHATAYLHKCRRCVKHHTPGKYTIVEQPVAGEEGCVTNIAVVQQVMPRILASSATQQDNMPSTMPRIVALEDPDFIEKAVSVTPVTAVVAVVRHWLKHRELTEENLHDVLVALDNFEEHVRREDPASLVKGELAGDSRTPTEKAAQRILQQKLIDMLRDEAKSAEAAVKCAVVAPKSTTSQQTVSTRPVTQQVLLSPSSTTAAGATTTMSVKPMSSRRTTPKLTTADNSKRLNYFTSEEALDFLHSSAPPPQSRAATTTTIKGKQPTVAQQLVMSSDDEEGEAPPVVGMTVGEEDYGDDTDDLIYTVQQPQPQRTTPQQTKYGQQTVVKRSIKQSSMNMPPPPRQAFAVYPSTLSFGVLEAGYSYQLAITLTNMTFDSARFNIKQPSDASQLRLSFSRGPVAPGMSVKVLVQLRAVVAMGKMADEVVIVSSDDSDVRVAVTAEVLSQSDFSKLPVEEQKQIVHRWAATSGNPVVCRFPLRGTVVSTTADKGTPSAGGSRTGSAGGGGGPVVVVSSGGVGGSRSGSAGAAITSAANDAALGPKQNAPSASQQQQPPAQSTTMLPPLRR